MDEIQRLVVDLMEGRLTTAVPLLDRFAEAGKAHEADQLKALMSRASLFVGVIDRDGFRKRLDEEVRSTFWHLAPDRDEWLGRVERYATAGGAHPRGPWAMVPAPEPAREQAGMPRTPVVSGSGTFTPTLTFW